MSGPVLNPILPALPITLRRGIVVDDTMSIPGLVDEVYYQLCS